MLTYRKTTFVAWPSRAFRLLALGAVALVGCSGISVNDVPSAEDADAPGQPVSGDGGGSNSSEVGACCTMLFCETLSVTDCADQRGRFLGVGHDCDARVCVELLAALDSDNDGASDLEELERGDDPDDPTDGPDIDGDGIPNGSDRDVDGDGIPNFVDADIDGDGLLNAIDPDIDGDGQSNLIDRDDDADGGPEQECSDASDCDPGEICCLGLCFDPSGNPSACGDCQTECASGQACCTGVCVGGVDLADGCGGCSAQSECPGGCADGRCCDDNIPCTNDFFDGTKCRHDPKDARCDQGDDGCTKGICDPLEGCQLKTCQANETCCTDECIDLNSDKTCGLCGFTEPCPDDESCRADAQGFRDCTTVTVCTGAPNDECVGDTMICCGSECKDETVDTSCGDCSTDCTSMQPPRECRNGRCVTDCPIADSGECAGDDEPVCTDDDGCCAESRACGTACCSEDPDEQCCNDQCHPAGQCCDGAPCDTDCCGNECCVDGESCCESDVCWPTNQCCNDKTCDAPCCGDECCGTSEPDCTANDGCCASDRVCGDDCCGDEKPVCTADDGCCAQGKDCGDKCCGDDQECVSDLCEDTN